MSRRRPARFGARGWVLAVALLGAGALADLVLGARPPGLDALFGFASCVLIVVASKWLGKGWLQRPDGYYEEARRG